MKPRFAILVLVNDHMTRVIIQSTYLTEYGTRGYQGYESDYDSRKLVSDYINEFTTYIMHHDTGAWNINVYSVAKTVNNLDGTVKRDESGNRIEERLYFKNIW